MFHDLDKTLQAILNDSTAPVLLRDADISFETPDKSYAPSQPSINLFLHAVEENRQLRDPEPIYEVVDGQYMRRLPPLRMDCTYLVTTWSNETGGVKVAEEHHLLGVALAWLSRWGTIPARFLSGHLAEQPYDPPTLVAQMDGVQSLGDFWSALGISPRPAFLLVVTIALDLAVEEPLGPEAVAVKVTLLQLPDGATEASYVIGGRVRNADQETLVQGATVTIQELGHSTKTDGTGRYYFSGLKPQNYTLHISAAGFRDAEVTIAVADGGPNAFDVQLTALGT